MKLGTKILTILAGMWFLGILVGIMVMLVMTRGETGNLHWYVASIVIRGLLVLGTVWVLLKYFVLDRLLEVVRQITGITSKNAFFQRISISGSDELSAMVLSINSLLDIIETTEEELRTRIAHRTERLEHLSDLNKNLFNEINRQKSIEGKLREQEKSLRRFAYYDQLTGLPNRMFFREQMKKVLERAAKAGVGLVIMFLDADKFKLINDTYGHPVGDQFLCHVADHLRRVVKDSDMVARYAGDEFVIFLNNLRERSIINFMAEKILKAVSTPFIVDGKEIGATFSLGISIYPDHGGTIEELEHNADLAMYHAKNRQGNAYSYAEEAENNTRLTGSEKLFL